MNTPPGDYWKPDGQPTAITNETVTTREHVLKEMPEYPGANHDYIHREALQQRAQGEG